MEAVNYLRGWISGSSTTSTTTVGQVESVDYPLTAEQVLVEDACFDMEVLCSHLKDGKHKSAISTGIHLLRNGQRDDAFEQFKSAQQQAPSHDYAIVNTLHFCIGMMFEHGWVKCEKNDPYTEATYTYDQAKMETHGRVFCRIGQARLAEQGCTYYPHVSSGIDIYYEQAAFMHNSAKGYYHLARYFNRGGTTKAVVDLLMQGVIRGDIKACETLAKIYACGVFGLIKPDPAVADFWRSLADTRIADRRKSASANHSNSTLTLSKDKIDFHHYFPIALYGLIKLGKHNLTNCVSIFEEKYAPYQKDSVQIDTVRYSSIIPTNLKVDKKNYTIRANASYKIGCMYQTGNTYVRQSKTETIKFYEAAYAYAEKAITKGSVNDESLEFSMPELADKLADLYDSVNLLSLTDKDPKKASSWRDKSTRVGDISISVIQ